MIIHRQQKKKSKINETFDKMNIKKQKSGENFWAKKNTDSLYNEGVECSIVCDALFDNSQK